MYGNLCSRNSLQPIDCHVGAMINRRLYRTFQFLVVHRTAAVTSTGRELSVAMSSIELGQSMRSFAVAYRRSQRRSRICGIPLEEPPGLPVLLRFSSCTCSGREHLEDKWQVFYTCQIYFMSHNEQCKAQKEVKRIDFEHGNLLV